MLISSDQMVAAFFFFFLNGSFLRAGIFLFCFVSDQIVEFALGIVPYSGRLSVNIHCTKEE